MQFYHIRGKRNRNRSYSCCRSINRPIINNPSVVGQVVFGVEGRPLRDGQGFALVNGEALVQGNIAVHGAFRTVKDDAAVGAGTGTNNDSITEIVKIGIRCLDPACFSVHDRIFADRQTGSGTGGLRRSHIKPYPIAALSTAGGQAATVDGKRELRGVGGSYAGLHIDAGVARIGLSSLCIDGSVYNGQGGVVCSAFDIYSVIRTRYFQAAIVFTRNSQGGVCTKDRRAYLCIHKNPMVACDGILANQFDSQGN